MSIGPCCRCSRRPSRQPARAHAPPLTSRHSRPGLDPRGGRVFAALGHDLRPACGSPSSCPPMREVVGARQGELQRRHQRRRRHVAEGALRQARHVDHEGDAAARPDIGLGPAAGQPGHPALHRPGQPHRVLGHAGPQRAARAAHEQHRAERRLAVLVDQRDRLRAGRRARAARTRPQVRRPARSRRTPRPWSTPSAGVSPGRAPFFGFQAPRISSGSVSRVPPQPRPGLRHPEVAPRRRAVALDPDAGRLPAEHLAGLMFADDAGDVVVDHHHLVDQAPATAPANMPMVAEPQPTRIRRSRHAVDDGRAAGLHDDASSRRRWPARPPRRCRAPAARRR